MPSECVDCGNECVKTKGKYREFCQECLLEKAESMGHLGQCTEETCLMCDSKLREIQEVIQPLYVRALLKRRTDTCNQKLDAYL